ncbi:phosphatidylserine decarboxylase-domain-containing protein [Mycena vulgaris]|nr:phosphatidylserine decarboxylase-domain-containing protein [Mycena vulgaris]
MSTTLRPSVEDFRKAGWLPATNEIYNEWMKDLTDRIAPHGIAYHVRLLPPIQEFKEFIETNPTVYQEFVRMFEGITEPPTDYTGLLNMFNDIFRRAPYYGDLGPPVYMIMARIMNTQGGFSAFTKENLNLHFKKLFETWATFLSSADSRNVLVEGKFDDKHEGWFSDRAKAGMMAKYTRRTFEQVFICNEDAPYHGFRSYDDFFNRRFRSVEIDRPVVGGVNDTRIVGAPCESVSYNVQENVRMIDQLFIKDEAYSLVHLLNNDSLMEAFDGGSVIQGFLGTTDYHRWHAPVTGTIRKIVDVPGTYFAQAPSTIGNPIPDDDSVLPPYLQSLRYFSHTAARQLMFIDADHADIGLICFISIGMTEISTCQATVYDGQHVERGDETGMFHFGGSSFAVVFRKESKVEIDGKFKKSGTPIKINDAIAAVNQ